MVSNDTSYSVVAATIIGAKLAGVGMGAGALTNLSDRAVKRLRNLSMKVKAKRLTKNIDKALEDSHSLDKRTKNELILSRELAKAQVDKHYSGIGASTAMIKAKAVGAKIASVGLAKPMAAVAALGGGFVAGDILVDKILDHKKRKIRKLEAELHLYERRLKAVRETGKTNSTRYHSELKLTLVDSISQLKNKIISLKISK